MVTSSSSPRGGTATASGRLGAPIPTIADYTHCGTGRKESVLAFAGTNLTTTAVVKFGNNTKCGHDCLGNKLDDHEGQDQRPVARLRPHQDHYGGRDQSLGEQLHLRGCSDRHVLHAEDRSDNGWDDSNDHRDPLHGSLPSVGFGAASRSFTVTSATKITATTNAQSAGTVAISVSTVGGTSASSTKIQCEGCTDDQLDLSLDRKHEWRHDSHPYWYQLHDNSHRGVWDRVGNTCAEHDRERSDQHDGGYRSTPPRQRDRVDYHPWRSGKSKLGLPLHCPHPIASSFAPTGGATSGGTAVIISGSGFFGAQQVRFGTTAASSFAVTSPTKITAYTEPHVAGSVAVKVVTTGGTVSASGMYNYVAPTPTITSVTPHSGSAGGGTTVVISGTGLFGATTVTFGQQLLPASV